MALLIRCLLVLTMALAVPAWAHKASDAYLQLRIGDHAVDLRVDVALRDLDVALDLDADGDSRLTWREVRAAWPAIDRLVLAGVALDGCPLAVTSRALERRGDGAYAALGLHAECSVRGEPALRYTLLRDVDPTHRGIARIERAGSADVVRVLDPSQPEPQAVAHADPGKARAGFVAEGIHHILTGYDHVLFLLCLLLPSVMRREPGAPARWRPVDALPQALLPVLGVVTAFTVAHSITLGLAAMKWVALPSRVIEPAIAATIVVAAIDNLVPIFRGHRAAITFAFGLIHGFGFAGVLAELDLPARDFAWALLQFNIGIELGQVAVVLAAALLLYAVRTHRRYPAWVIRGGSAAAILVGVLWFIERTADIALLPL